MNDRKLRDVKNWPGLLYSPAGEFYFADVTSWPLLCSAAVHSPAQRRPAQRPQQAAAAVQQLPVVSRLNEKLGGRFVIGLTADARGVIKALLDDDVLQRSLVYAMLYYIW